MSSYQRTTRRQRFARYAKARKERVPTGLGVLYSVLRFFGLARITRWLMRRPWHVADMYVAGRFQEALYVYPHESTGDRLKRIDRAAQERAKKETGQRPQHERA